MRGGRGRRCKRGGEIGGNQLVSRVEGVKSNCLICLLHANTHLSVANPGQFYL